MKKYYLKTQKDYDNLMSELESQGYTWSRGEKPTELNMWTAYGKNTYVLTNSVSKQLQYGGSEYEVVQYEAEKVVVPQFVADWYEEYEAESLYATLGYFLNGVGSTEELEKWGETCEGESAYPKVNAEKKIAEMYLHGYEVEEEKKYYWRKKEEYLLDFEKGWGLYLNFDESDDSIHFTVNKFEGGYLKTKFTEAEAINLIGKDDFERLEKVEIGVG